MSPEIVRLSHTILHKPMKMEVIPVSSTADRITQYIYFVDKGNKTKLHLEILKGSGGTKTSPPSKSGYRSGDKKWSGKQRSANMH